MKFRCRAGGRVSAAAIVALLSAGPALAGDVIVTQKNMQFSQNELTLHRGDTLTFANDDGVRHNISVRSEKTGDTTDLGIQRPKVSVSYKFTDEGVYAVVCNIHPKMRLKVYVK